jgi:hypothetical protein
MSKEIDILLEASRQGCAIVDKDSHVLLEGEELKEAQGDGLYQEEGIRSRKGPLEVSGPFPGCLQLGAATGDDLDFRVLGQTRHFVIFCPAKGPLPRLGPLAEGELS